MVVSRSFPATHYLKCISQKPSETDGLEHPAENVLAALKSGNRPGYCRISEGLKLGNLYSQRACFRYNVESFVEPNQKIKKLSQK